MDMKERMERLRQVRSEQLKKLKVEVIEIGSGDMCDPSQLHYIHPVTGRVTCETLTLEPSLTQQQWAEDCDINNIVEKYAKTGVLNEKTRGVYADISDIKDYQTMLHQVAYAQERFMDLPAKIRARFENDPGKFLEFCSDSNNRDEAVQLGLIEKMVDDVTPNAKNSNNANQVQSKVLSKNQKPKTPEVSEPAVSNDGGNQA